MTESGPPPVGVLVMAHGTPPTPAAIEPFYTAIRRGRPPTPEQVGELMDRYQAIGGTSPLTERTRAQVEGLASTLEDIAPGQFHVRYGAKFASPTIEDGLAELAAAGVRKVVGIVLTPHQSSLGSGEYLRRASEAAAAASPPIGFRAVASWHRAPGFASLLADRLATALCSLGSEQRQDVAVLFTAHSLPERVVAEGDPYPDQVGESGSDIAELLALDGVPGLSWGVAWQSAGRTPEPWLGPSLLPEIRRAAERGATSVVVCPVGFVSDHLEVLYDLDIEADQAARAAGMAFTRTASLNDDPRFLEILADVVSQTAGSFAGVTPTGTMPTSTMPTGTMPTGVMPTGVTSPP